MKSCRFIHCLAVGASLALLLRNKTAVADSWAPPSETEALSENGRFLARDIPGKQQTQPVLIVFSISGGQTNEIWRTKLSNRVAPSQVLLSNDGESAVTLDNWGGIGYGDDVVAIYSRGGLLAEYSLEQFAPPPKTNSDSFLWRGRGVYDGLFTHTTSSRHWRENSIEFFFEERNEKLFSLWLDWDNRWVVWRLTDGGLAHVSSELSSRLNLQGRVRARHIAESAKPTAAAMSFLGRQRIAEDRPIIEKWLHDTEFNGGMTMIPRSRSGETHFAFISRSNKRAAADWILSQWDRVEPAAARLEFREQYKLLGTLKCTVSFVASPRKQDGLIGVYLIPSSSPLSRWSKQRPEHYLIADLRSLYPFDFVNGQVKSVELGNSSNFIIYGVTPGRYRLKAIWSKAPPRNKDHPVMWDLSPGDYESLESPEIFVQKGKVTEEIRIDCKRLVEQ